MVEPGDERRRRNADDRSQTFGKLKLHNNTGLDRPVAAVSGMLLHHPRASRTRGMPIGLKRSLKWFLECCYQLPERPLAPQVLDRLVGCALNPGDVAIER